MSEFTSEGSQAADEEVEYVQSEPNDDPLTKPGNAAESEALSAAESAAEDQQENETD